MVRAIAVSIIVVLLVSSSALGQGEIYQGFDFEGSLGSTLALTEGPGVASFSQGLMIGNEQSAAGVGTTAMQGMGGLLGQTASANGFSAELPLDQMSLEGTIDPSILSLGIPSTEAPVQDVGGSLGTIGQTQGVVVAWPTDGANPSTEWQAMPIAWTSLPINLDQ